jgi:hypothetical protein
MNLKTVLLTSALITMAGVATQASAQIIYASYTGSQTGVTIRDSNLNQSMFIPMNFGPKSVAAGAANSFYVTSGNKISKYAANGTVMATFSWPDTTINYTGITYAGANIYASYNGSQQGFTIRNSSTLVQSAAISTPFNPTAIAAGPNNTVYLASGNHLYKYSTSGSLLIDMNFPDTGVVYTGISVKDNRVYASYKGSQKGFTVRDLNLVQQSFVSVGFEPSGISAGINNDVYLSTVDNLYRYAISGAQMNTINFPAINYTGIASEKAE